MSKINQFKTKVKEKVKAMIDKFPYMPAFVGGMVSAILIVHFLSGPPAVEESAKVEPEIVAVTPQAPAQVIPVQPRPVIVPAPEVRVYTTRIPAETAKDRPIVVEIHQAPAPVPVQQEPEPAPVPKEMPEHLKLTPENIARMQNINRPDGDADEFDVDFDQEPAKEVKK